MASPDTGILTGLATGLIAATSLIHNVPLLTRDRALLKSKQNPLAR